MAGSLMGATKVDKEQLYDFDIPSQSIESALNMLATQASVLLLFPYETVQQEKSNTVAGTCTVNEALSVMLQGTSLKGGLTESGVITISYSGNEGDKSHMKNNKSSTLNKKIATTVLSVCATANTIAQDTTTTNTEQRKAEEEIIVTGIRASLEAANDLKRSDGRIMDAIVAEDIGKLPDNNIAEALQRIPGVSINKDFGVGTSVSIRGLSQNRVELNGRTTIGDSRDGISMEDFPASFLKSVSVIKSPTADMIEGALGGTVRMETIRPLELTDLTAAVSLDAEYADKTEEIGPIFNASIGDNWDLDDAGSVGALLLFSYQDRQIRSDEYSNRIILVDPDTVAAAGGVNLGPANTPSGDYLLRDQNRVEQFVEDRERTAFNIQLEWAPPSDKGRFYLDIAVTERDGQQAGNSILEVAGTLSLSEYSTQDEHGQLNNTTLEGAFAIPKTWSDFRKTDSFTNAIGGEWDFTDTVTVSGELSTASSESYAPRSEFNLRPVNKTNWNTWADQYDPAEWAGDQFSAYDTECRGEFDCRHTVDVNLFQTGNLIPAIDYSDPNVYLDPENLAIRAFWYNGRSTDNDEVALRFDVDIAQPFGSEWLTKLDIGVRVTERDYEFDEQVFRFNDIYRTAFTDFDTADERPATFWADDFEALFPGSFTTVSHPNSFEQTGLTGEQDLLTHYTYRGDLLANPEATFERVNQLLAGTNLEVNGGLHDNTQSDLNSFRDIAEETSAVYVSADINVGKLTGIVGARYVQTEIDSGYFQDGELRVDSHDYSDFLPSINLNYSLADDTYLRFAAAKVMRRADFEDLSPSLLVDGFSVSATSGSAELAPNRATQYDLSIEHYYGDTNVASFALYYKDVESFLSLTGKCIASEVTAEQNVTEWQNICQLEQAGVDNDNIVLSNIADFGGDDTAGFNFIADLRDQGLTGINTAIATNGENGSIQGFEASIQQSLDFLPGLGFSANYTYADSEQPNGSTLLDVSKNTFNGQIYWEYGGFQVRLAYNYRSRYLATEDERLIELIGALALGSSTDEESDPGFDPTSGNNYREGRGQYDFSASWDINDSVTLVGNVTNLTGEPSLFTTELGSTWKYTEADSRYSLGVRAKF